MPQVASQSEQRLVSRDAMCGGRQSTLRILPSHNFGVLPRLRPTCDEGPVTNPSPTLHLFKTALPICFGRGTVTASRCSMQDCMPFSEGIWSDSCSCMGAGIINAPVRRLNNWMWQSDVVLVSDFGSDRGKFVIYSFWKNAVLPICKSRSGFHPAWPGGGYRRVLAGFCFALLRVQRRTFQTPSPCGFA